MVSSVKNDLSDVSEKFCVDNNTTNQGGSILW